MTGWPSDAQRASLHADGEESLVLVRDFQTEALDV